eukprot:1155152-Pelagomonas_calceolata.AAC.10
MQAFFSFFLESFVDNIAQWVCVSQAPGWCKPDTDGGPNSLMKGCMHPKPWVVQARHRWWTKSLNERVHVSQALGGANLTQMVDQIHREKDACVPSPWMRTSTPTLTVLRMLQGLTHLSAAHAVLCNFFGISSLHSMSTGLVAQD